jgi:L-lactate dehydrogenase (cytochrome)
MNRDSNDTQRVKLTGEEIAKHVTKDDCWVIVHGKGKSSHRSMPRQDHQLISLTLQHTM